MCTSTCSLDVCLGPTERLKEYSLSFSIPSAAALRAAFLILAHIFPHPSYCIFQYFRNLTTGMQAKISTEFCDLWK